MRFRSAHQMAPRDRLVRTVAAPSPTTTLLLLLTLAATTSGVEPASSSTPPAAAAGGGASNICERRQPTSDSRNRKQFRIAAILPSLKTSRTPWKFSKELVAPAVDVALQTVNGGRLLPAGVGLVIRYADSACDSAESLNHAVDFYIRDEVDAFFGPCCDYAAAPIARQTRYWRIPMLTAGAVARDYAVDKTREFPMLTRVGANLNSLAQFIITLLRTYGWSKLTQVYDPYGHKTELEKFCHLTADSIHQALMKDVANFTQDYYKITNEQSLNDEKMKSEIGREYSIIVLCASPEAVREIMIKAHELNFDNGEYVFFNIDLFSSKSKIIKPWYRANDTEDRNYKARKAYEALMTVTLRKPDSDEYKNFSDEVKRRAQRDYGENIFGDEEVNSFVGAFHDAVILYALALNDTLTAKEDPSNGTAVTAHMWNRTFTGITGTVSIDANGDRNADYSLLDLNPESGEFEVVANYYGNTKQYVTVPDKEIHWAGGATGPPPDTPKCGFDGAGCPPEEPFPLYAVVIIVLGSLLAIVCIAALLVYRHYKMEAELAEVNWRIRWEEISFGPAEKRKLERSGSRMSLARRGSLQSNVSADTIAVALSNVGTRQIFTKTGSYRGSLVAIKRISRPINLSKPLLFEFKKMRDLQNDHIVRFIGVCIDPGNQCILTEYCQKGSLQDVLENEQLKLDNMFKFSLMQDIVRGMAYIHASDIKSHGNLKSSNCVVDSRFVLKITDFGLHSLRVKDDQMDDAIHAYYSSKLWTAPELLRMHNPPPEGTQKGDVYSFAIICQEIIYRNGPFWLEDEDLTAEEIYRRVKEGRPYIRPTLLEQGDDDMPCNEDLLSMLRRCWSEEPSDRPEFHSLKSVIKRINKESDTGGNLLDNLLSRMEQYACNLEGLVEERTADYLEQKKRAEDLLYMMLPESVARQLMRGLNVEAVKFDSVTIYFSDICGFTQMSAESTPMQVVDLLNDLYTTFDEIIGTVDVYKVETIGDAYMVVSGLPEKNGIIHAREIARMALKLLNAVKSFRIRHRPDDKLRLRIGIHSGPVCAGVVGRKMPRYCLFGDTVNTASRMESNGIELKIHVSPDTKALLDTFNTFILELRGPVEMKGKGTITTYWLLGETNPDFPDLVPPNETNC